MTFWGEGSQVAADHVIHFGRVLTSTVSNEPDTEDKLGILFSVEGIGGIDYSGDEPALDLADDAGEGDQDAEVYTALGILARPLPPSTEEGRERHAEVVCLRLADGLIPIAVRDVRIRMQGEAPSEGQIALVGYGGGFVSFTPVNDGEDGTISTMYCPYDYDGDGVAQKAHAIVMDPSSGNESISIVHAEGMAITMFQGTKNEIVIKNKNGSASIILDDDGITMTGQINLSGSVVVGNPSTAVPMLAGVASPPCSVLWLSP